MTTFDSHAHIGEFAGFLSGGERTPETLIAEWDAAGVEGGIISVIDHHDVPASNDRVRAACAAYLDRISGYIYLYLPDVEGSLRELERCAPLDSFRGVKLHPANDAYFPFYKGFDRVYARIEELGLPTLWHTGTYPFSHPLQIATVARRFPGSTHILGHFGIAELSWECTPAAELAENIVVDTSINPIIGLINDFIAQFGAERVLWGSDYPFYNIQYEQLKIQFLGTSDAERKQIAGDNARRIFGL